MVEHRPQAGFTLLEMLVALVVLGLLMVGLTEGSRFGFQAWRHQANTIAAHDQFDAVDRALRQLVTQAALHESDERGALAFTGQLPLAVGLATRRADMQLLVDRQHRLILRWTSLPHEISLELQQKRIDTVLMPGLDRLDIAYWRETDATTGEPAGWAAEWDGVRQPHLLKLTLVFPDGDSRRWPPIVIAPSALGPGG
ncbi:MAG: gspJ [Rhodospirillales bacterium]|nr:gspJ [Rhodospirillales bacterium]